MLVICGCIFSCSNGTTLEVKQLVEKNLIVRGGYEKIKAIKSLTIHGKHLENDMEFPITIKIYRPNFIRIEAFFPHDHWSGAYDGKTAWWLKRVSPRSKPEEVSGQQALSFKCYAEFGYQLIDYKARGQTVELIGIEESNRRKYYKLKLSPIDDIHRLIYLDANSFLIAKESIQSKRTPDVQLTVHHQAHREVQGVLFPHLITASVGDKPGGKTVIDKIETGVHLDISIFKMPRTGASAKMSEDEFKEELDTLLHARTRNELFSGVVLIARNGTPFFKRAYGMADRERRIPNRIDTRFNLASMNKMFTSVAIAQLVEQKKLAYGDLAGKYLGPDWMLPEVGKRVKIAHLLSHTSGIEEYLTDELLNSSANIYRKQNDYKALVKEKALYMQPGNKLEYCNTNFIFLGAIIEKVSGMTYSDYIEKYIYKPLGMNNTIEFSKDKMLPDVAMGYERVDLSGKPRWQKTAFAGKINGSPTGGGFSTVEDLLKFANALRSDTLMTQKSREVHMTERAGSKSFKYGFGFVIYKKDELGPAVGHGGSAPGVSTNFRIFMDKGYTMIILTNFSESSLAAIGIIRNLLPQLD